MYTILILRNSDT